MNVITVSREYGAGGGEVAAKLAKLLGWEVLDRELLHQAAEAEHLPDADLEQLDEKAISLADRFSLHPLHGKYLHGMTEAVRQAATRGKVILVGRGARQLLGDMPNCFHLRLVAPLDWRAGRMAQREGWTYLQASARCVAVDRMRDRYLRYFFGADALEPASFDLVANSSRTPLDLTAASVAAAALGDWPGEGAATGPGLKRILTLARELGAGDSGFALTLASRLKLRVYDRELLEREAVRLGVPETELEKVDEQPAGLFQRFWPGSLHQRYFEAMGQLMSELARRGDVLIVGRGGSRFLRDQPGAFHVRLVAPMAQRVPRVMEHRWLRQGPAEQLIAASDRQRRQFYESCFGAAWASPLEYHATVNTGRLGTLAVDLIADLASRIWTSRR